MISGILYRNQTEEHVMTHKLLAITMLLTAALNGTAAAQEHDHAAAGTPAVVRPMTGLGSHTHKISTRVPEAQLLFDQ